VHRSSIAGGDASHEPKSRRESAARDSCKKPVFGERRCDVKPVTMKIFALPKTATQSPRNALLTGPGESP